MCRAYGDVVVFDDGIEHVALPWIRLNADGFAHEMDRFAHPRLEQVLNHVLWCRHREALYRSHDATTRDIFSWFRLISCASQDANSARTSGSYPSAINCCSHRARAWSDSCRLRD